MEAGEARAPEHVPGRPLGWLLNWSAVFAGVLIGLGATVVLTLAASAIGNADAAGHLVRWEAFTRSALIFSVITGLVAFFVAGFFTSKIAGARTFEGGLLHGAMTGFVSVLLLLVLGAIGVQHFLGNYSMGLLAPPVWLTPDVPTAAVDPKTASTARDIAVSAVFAMFMAMLGAMIGGVLGSDEFAWRRQRRPAGFRARQD